jgi:predicted DNA-binding transcriptional regulator YafY
MRDLAELRESGYPIESDRGRGGGIRLTGRWGIDRLSLSDQEVISMLVALAISESLKSPILGASVKSVRQKITQSFPSKQRQLINKLRTRVLVGDRASELVVNNYVEPRPQVIGDVESSFFNQKQLFICYQAETGVLTERVIDPQYLLLNWPAWYICGWDHLRDGPRLFRVDRIMKAKALPAPFTLKRKEDLMQGYSEYFRVL